jgi:hypothetical protein
VTLSEFAGVFSRYFVIGFFAPAFFAAVAVSQLVDPDFFPASYREASGTAKLAILGGVALLTGLVLSGLHYHVTRLFEGYPLRRFQGRRVLGWPHDWLLSHWQGEFDRRAQALKEESSPSRTSAARELNRGFPALRTSVLPTRFGNAVRSFETHGRARYGLDGISAWPRISLLLNDAEREQVTEAQTDVAFFLNSALMSVGAALALLIDTWWHPPASALACVAQVAILISAGLGLYWASYRAATSAAMRWGSPVRAAYDLHRLELYDRLGLVQPRDQTHEEAIARVANRLLLFGEPIPDAFRRPPQEPRRPHE